MSRNQFVGNTTKSIAVLPFVNMSADPENEYFSDGITEEIINALTTVQGLKVIARTSSFAFKGRNIDVRTIGRQLGVVSILEGSVRKAKDRVRITAQLINTKDGMHLWSENFDRKLEDIFVVQDEISLLIADHIRENFGHLDLEEKLIIAPKISIENYQLFLKGKYYLHRFNSGDITLAISILKDIVKKQPEFALAHVNIHYAYNSMAAGGLMPVKEALTIGKHHLDQAFALDEDLPECYHSLGWHSLNADWDFSNSAKSLRKAIALRPGYADAHQKLFITLALEGNLELAFKHISTAHQLDPLAPLNNYFLAYYYYLTEDFEQSNHYMERTFQIDASFLVGYSIYALSLVLQKRGAYILEKAETIPPVHGAELEKMIMQTLALSSLGKVTQAIEKVNSLRTQLQGGSRERVRFFLIYAETILGRHENALDLIEEGVAQREPLMTLLKVDPLLRPLHSFERFQAALQKIYALSELSAPPSPKMTPPSSMSPSEITYFLQMLEELMNEKKIFLDSSLSLRMLAQQLKLHPNKLSWLLNEKIGKNFNEYINSLRLEAFKTKALDPANHHLTLLGLAYESGFTSKTVFNAFFKKSEGMTPKVWVRSNQI